MQTFINGLILVVQTNVPDILSIMLIDIIDNDHNYDLYNSASDCEHFKIFIVIFLFRLVILA